MKIYEPKEIVYLENLERTKPSAWGDIPHILSSIIKDFGIPTKNALEFGVEFGYSTSALANIFEEVLGVDTFEGDIHTRHRGDHFIETKESLSKWPNIFLVKSDYRDFIKECKDRFNLIHVDIVHTYQDTYDCGEWSIQHSDITIFHDTESYPEVKKACTDLADKYSLDFYNYTKSYGLGILVKPK